MKNFILFKDKLININRIQLIEKIDGVAGDFSSKHAIRLNIDNVILEYKWFDSKEERDEYFDTFINL